MPNHIQNRLTIIADSEKVAEVKEFLKTVDGENTTTMDFNKIVPMPKELSITSDGYLMALENRFCSRDIFKETLDKLRGIKEKAPQRFEETRDNFLQGVKNYLDYGYATWYAWCQDNWGTKWNAYGVNDRLDTENTIHFQTAWNAPLDLIAKLSAKFPEVRFQLDYADEDSSCNTGNLSFLDGSIISSFQPECGSVDGYNIYFDLHPGRKDNYELVDGVYKYKEEEESDEA